jgi:hypothetical protein
VGKSSFLKSSFLREIETEIETMTMSENTYLTRDSLWRELDALGEDRVRERLAQGDYNDRTRLLAEE